MFHKGTTTYIVALCNAFFFTLILAITGMIGYHSVLLDPFLTIDQVNPDSGAVDSSVSVNMEEVPDPEVASAIKSTYSQLSTNQCIYDGDHGILPQQDTVYPSYDAELCSFQTFNKSPTYSFGVENGQCWYGDICANAIMTTIFNNKEKTTTQCNGDGNAKLFIPTLQIADVQKQVNAGLAMYTNQANARTNKEVEKESKRQDTEVINKIKNLSTNIDHVNTLVKQSNIPYNMFSGGGGGGGIPF
jgi:hypothetical protein